MSDANGVVPMIVVSGLTKVFDNGRIHALDGVDLVVHRGEFIAVTGPSGCGKSTLMHLLAGLDEPTSGTIHIDGVPLGHHRRIDEYRRTTVGLVFQLHNLLPNLTALQNVEVPMAGTGLNRGEQRERARQLLASVGLAARAGSRPNHLSGGERQRVAIARALANQPPILLADEPTGSLDTESVADVLALLRKIREDRGITIVMVTHDPAVAATADRRIRMRDGRVERPVLEPVPQ